MKILCLHGYRQSAQVFKDKTGSLRKLLKKHAELIYISAPHVIPAPAPTAPSLDVDETSSELTAGNNDVIPEQLGWYFSTSSLTFNSHDVTEFSGGLESSLEVVSRVFKEQGPFDGILGFSQGATLASILCDLLEKGALNFSFKFAILVSGFKSRLAPHSHFFQVKKTIPTLHVIGETDRIVEKEMSEELTNYFESPQVMKHAGGHYVPATAKERAVYVNFLEQFPS